MRDIAILCVIVSLGWAACSREPGAPAVSTPTAPTASSPAITNYAGPWHGNFTITQCNGQRHCALTIGQQSPFVLLLQQSGARVDGVFRVGFGSFTIPVEGDVSADGTLTLTGLRPSPGESLPRIELTRFTARRSDGAGVVGEFSYVAEYPPGSPLAPENSPPQVIGGNISSATLGSPVPVSSFAGRWTGSGIITTCVAGGPLGCYPEDLSPGWGFELTLTQTDDLVAGELRLRQRFSVTGTVAGNALTLDPSTTRAIGSSDVTVWSLRSWTMTKDGVGQVRGSVSYDREVLWAPSLNRAPDLARYQVAILSGILEP